MHSQVTTYDVIPVSQSVGLMEFVPDTDQLLTVISPGVIPAEDVEAARKAYSSCAAASPVLLKLASDAGLMSAI